MNARLSSLSRILFLSLSIFCGIDCRHSTEPPLLTGPDTTSHDFVWTTYEFGDGNSSVLNDVAIINDTLAYAVGEIYLKDSTGQLDPAPYNVAVWNGNIWNTKKVPYNYQGQLFYRGTECIFALASNDIWIAGNGIQHWDGSHFTESELSLAVWGQNLVKKIWARNSSDLYVVGTSGAIAHYDGNSWQKIGGGSTVELLDVYGTPDGSTVWACGWRDLNPTVLLRIQGTQVEKVYENSNFGLLRSDSLSSVLSSVCSPTGNYLFVASNYGLYQCPIGTHGEGSRLSFSPDYFPGFPFRVRANGDNDLLVVGEYDFISHYNGRTWRYYDQLTTQEGHFASVAMKGNIAMAVGYHYHSPTNVRAVIAVGRRQ